MRGWKGYMYSTKKGAVKFRWHQQKDFGFLGEKQPRFRDTALKCVELVPSGNAPLNYFAPYWPLPKSLSTCWMRIAEQIYAAPTRQANTQEKKSKYLLIIHNTKENTINRLQIEYYWKMIWETLYTFGLIYLKNTIFFQSVLSRGHWKSLWREIKRIGRTPSGVICVQRASLLILHLITCFLFSYRIRPQLAFPAWMASPAFRSRVLLAWPAAVAAPPTEPPPAPPSTFDHRRVHPRPLRYSEHPAILPSRVPPARMPHLRLLCGIWAAVWRRAPVENG